jgi:type IX secretion system PorP/SprF family membrane protein
MKFIVYISTLVTTLSLGLVFGQQDPQFTQYFENTLHVNPAYAGSRGLLNVTSLHREQWVGFDGAPRSTTLSIHSPLKYESVGLGFTAVNDQIGPLNQTMVYADFSYSLKFKRDRKLSFGLKGGFNLINIGSANLQTTQASDPKLIQNVRNEINGNFGAGIYYHTPWWFVGFSSPRILEQSYSDSPSMLEQRHYFGILGGIVKINPTWMLRMSSQVKMTVGAPISADFQLTGIWNNKLWIGAMYRLDAAFGGFVQYKISPQFRIGVASDFGTQRLRNYNSGTFEAMLSYDFIFKKVGIRSPRHF